MAASKKVITEKYVNQNYRQEDNSLNVNVGDFVKTLRNRLIVNFES